jgi:hypothetical protein
MTLLSKSAHIFAWLFIELMFERFCLLMVFLSHSLPLCPLFLILFVYSACIHAIRLVQILVRLAVESKVLAVDMSLVKIVLTSFRARGWEHVSQIERQSALLSTEVQAARFKWHLG